MGNELVTLVTSYWWVGAIVVVGAGYVAARKIASPKAKAFVDAYLRKLEASAFAAGDTSVGMLADKVYAALPTSVRLFVPRAVFDVFVVDSYRTIKSDITTKKDIAASATAPVAPSAPIVAAPVEAPAVASAPVAVVTPVVAVAPSVADAPVAPTSAK